MMEEMKYLLYTGIMFRKIIILNNAYIKWPLKLFFLSN